MNRFLSRTLLMTCAISAIPFQTLLRADDLAWPHLIDASEAKIVVYQPQPESLSGNKLSARLAVAVSTSEKSEPDFGTVWLTSRLDTDREQRTASLSNIEVTKIRLPNVDQDRQKKLESLLESEMPKWTAKMDLDQLTSSLAVAEIEQRTAQGLKHDPPQILYVDHPALLVSIDGKPVLRQIENSNLIHVVNTPYLIALSYQTNLYYLFDGRDWMEATDVMGPWKFSRYPPEEVVELDHIQPSQRASAKGTSGADPVPEIIVATNPSELIVTDGPAKYTPIDDIGLEVVSNTDSRLLRDSSTQNLYILLSGRWYTSGDLKGPWAYVAADQLPDSFAKIPAESSIGEVRTHVPGTQEAKDAILDAQVPTTAIVDRDKTIAVRYEGTPSFQPIEGTDMRYAVNTASSVVHTHDGYYSADQGVWYRAEGPVGPWSSATAVPEEIYSIPASSPVYNLTYVDIFDSTDEQVVVGYYPGYTGSYVHGASIVYGTGYNYRPYVGASYYTRPATWGYQVHYNPRAGWGFGFSYSTGYFPYSVGFHTWDPCCWWGPARVGPRGPYDPRGPFDPRGPLDPRGPYDPRGIHDPRRMGDQRGPGHAGGVQDPRVAREARGPVESRGGLGPNNVFAGREGNVYRRSNDGWQQHGGDRWGAAGAAPHMEPQHAARQMGAARAGGGFRGGGGRRR